jgi:A/G-specific adenine glycosylase
MNHIVFIRTVLDYYKKNKRSMPWRDDVSPYSVFISEVMLQQTQVARVLIKYSEFIRAFPDFKSLCQATTSQLLSAWQGMGYNRRALYLKAAAQIIMEKYHGILPDDPFLLDELLGIGPATACSIAAFAYNKPVVFIETNIRRVYLHYFFANKEDIEDLAIIPFVERTIDKKNPREWYWALMDYGAYLGSKGDNPNRKSKHYAKQKKFVGSMREVRGGVIKLLLEKAHTKEELNKIFTDERLFAALEQMEKEGFIIKEKEIYCIR